MMPWKKREKAAAEAAQKARRAYEAAKVKRIEVDAIAQAIQRQNRRNGWMEDLEKIIGGMA